MKRTLFTIALTFCALALTSNTTRAQDAPTDKSSSTANESGAEMPRPKVIIFDVNETLLDLSPLKTSVGKALGGREDLLPLWFSTMLHYSLVETLTDNYHHFGEIGTAALMMVAKTQGIDLDYDTAKAAIVTPLRSLPPHADVVVGITSLSKSGYKIVSLTNSSAAGVETQFNNAGLTELFEKRYTVESLKKYKPHPDTYRMVLKDLGVRPEEVLMVAAHAWDIAGATNVGLQTAFVARPGKTLYPNAPRPDYVVKDLSELVQVLQKTKPVAAK
ncbi:(S)-2-haloacid dehalogenase [Rosistilla oblonga]|uniref:haloacid dehalogenase type II n=1 Tax=Rosistilla oblonga TaxID=2527990 RepID=UPI00118A58CD|nr:(S)-2-haloacid dehalogenase [Rosistilla oblonga]